jgi:hypothetical protein
MKGDAANTDEAVMTAAPASACINTTADCNKASRCL